MASGGFLDPKARGMNLGYDQAVALPAMQADGKSGQEDIFKETNKVGVGLMQGGNKHGVEQKKSGIPCVGGWLYDLVWDKQHAYCLMVLH